MSAQRWSVLAVVLLLVCVGCARIPTSGPVEEATRFQNRGPGGVEIAPQPPPPGASKQRILEGFLHAMASPDDYSAARQYLLPQVRDQWSPGAAVWVYTDMDVPDVTEDHSLFSARLIGQVRDGGYDPVERTLRHDFGIVQDDQGQWRISRPPRGVFVSKQLFSTLYARQYLYFVDPSLRNLVPDARYLARSSLTAQTVTDALLAGPRSWLAPAVRTMVPSGAALSPAGVHVGSDGVARVDLDEGFSTVTFDHRRLLAAQLVATLRQLPDVTSVQLTINGQVYAAGVEDASGRLNPTSLADYGPVDPALVTTAYGLREGRVVTVNDQQPLPGELGEQRPDASSLAVNDLATQVAVVSAGSVLRSAPSQANGRFTDRLRTPGLLRPQYNRYGELWAMATTGTGTQVFRGSGSDPLQAVSAPGLDGVAVSAFRISPDATRALIIGRQNGAAVVGFVRIERGDGGASITGWRRLVLGPEGPSSVLDMAWGGPSTVYVLGEKQGRRTVYTMDDNAVDIREISRQSNWTITQLAASHSEQQIRLLAVAPDALWAYEEQYSWRSEDEGTTAVAYPG